MKVKNRFTNETIGDFDINPKSNLGGADLREADLRGADLPPPTMILLAKWGQVPDSLCIDLMHYDAHNHPNPAAFDDWANGGKCPYDDVSTQRCANFQEDKKLWVPLTDDIKVKSAYQLMMALLREKCVIDDE